MGQLCHGQTSNGHSPGAMQMYRQLFIALATDTLLPYV